MNSLFFCCGGLLAPTKPCDCPLLVEGPRGGAAIGPWPLVFGAAWPLIGDRKSPECLLDCWRPFARPWPVKGWGLWFIVFVLLSVVVGEVQLRACGAMRGTDRGRSYLGW
jgi:hypothetical protein